MSPAPAFLLLTRADSKEGEDPAVVVQTALVETVLSERALAGLGLQLSPACTVLALKGDQLLPVTETVAQVATLLRAASTAPAAPDPTWDDVAACAERALRDGGFLTAGASAVLSGCLVARVTVSTSTGPVPPGARSGAEAQLARAFSRLGVGWSIQFAERA